MSNFDENVIAKLKRLEREVERLKVHESPGAWIDWTPTETGWTALPTGVYRYTRIGKLVTCMVSISDGTSDATDATLTLPFTAATITNAAWSGANGTAVDNGGLVSTATRWRVGSAGTTVAFYKDMGVGTWTAAGQKRIFSVFTYEAA